MSSLPNRDCSALDFVNDYERHLLEIRGLAPNSCKLHLRVVRYLFSTCFPDGGIRWDDFRFSQVADFIVSEFKRLPNHFTQKVWLVAIRGFLRYLEMEEHIPQGWNAALPRKVNRKDAILPRCLSTEQLDSLWNACRKQTHRHIRDRALLFVYTRLGLRTQEVAALALKDIDWVHGNIIIRSTKMRRERVLPLPDDVGQALIEYLRVRPQNSPQIFASRQPPFTPQRCLSHVSHCMASLFRRAGLLHVHSHSLRHTTATRMVNSGASFKEVADVLGHKSIASTLIYAKLDMNALAKVCLAWPGADL